MIQHRPECRPWLSRFCRLKPSNTNDGCHIDQVMGQSVAFQVGLPRVVAEPEAKAALRSLWTYNFTPDIGPYREGMKPVLPVGRWYALPGEGGLLMCTWPRGGAEPVDARSSQAGSRVGVEWLQPVVVPANGVLQATGPKGSVPHM